MDVATGLPITRSGIIAVPYDLDYGGSQAESGRSGFALDTITVGGSSGSPVFLRKAEEPIILPEVEKQYRSVGEPKGTELHYVAVCVKAREIPGLTNH